MKAISLWQPWASLWAVGRKRNETRHWPTNYRGPLLIHAAKTFCSDVPIELRDVLVDQFGIRWALDLPRGALVGICELEYCVRTEGITIDDDEAAQGNFSEGRFAWGARAARLFQRPIPYRGAQGFFDIPDHLVAEAAGIVGAFYVPPASPQGSLI